MAAPVNQTPGSTDSQDKNLSTSGRELYDLLVAYARQETTEPLKGLGQYLSYGAGGSIMVALGSTLLVIGVLRLLQTETGSTFTGNWSWAPYLLTLLVAVVIIALAVFAIQGTNTPGEKAARDRDRSAAKEG